MFFKFLFRIFFREMIFSELYVFVFFVFFCQNGVRAGDSGFDRKIVFKKNLTSQVGDDIKWKNLQEEVFQELNQLNFRKQREIFEDLKKQQEKMNSSHKNLTSLELQSLSPLNVEELKNIQKAIKSSNSTLPTIRNKRTLNLLLFVVAKAMGFSLIPTSFNVQWSPRTNQPPPPPPPPSSPPCPSTPPCKSSPQSPNPPCSQPATASPCSRPSTSTQPPTIPPNQIDANTISYPFRPAGTIPLFNFAPLPAGVTVPYPPLLQPPTRQPPPCSRAPPSSAPPCGSPSQPPAPPPCPAMPTSAPPCGMTATPASQPCQASAAPQPPCGSPPMPKSSQPCSAPPSQTPCGTSSPSPPPCPPGPSQSLPPVVPTEKAPKNSIFLEYDNPVRIHIFSDEKKYLPASGSIYRGQEDDYEENPHSYFFPAHEENRDKDKSEEREEEEEEREEIADKPMGFRDDEEEESEVAEEKDGRSRKFEYPERKQLDFYRYSQKEEENDSDDDESETNLSLVKKPVGKQVQRRRRISLKQTNPLANNINLGTKNDRGGDTLVEEKTFEETERVESIKKPKNKKWVRIVKKQKSRTKMDSQPQENFRIYSSNISPKSSFVSHRVYSRSATTAQASQHGFHKDFPNSVGENVRNVTKTDIKKINFKEDGSENFKSLKRVRRYKENGPKHYETDVEDENRKRLEKVVERYIEDFIEKQLSQEIIKNTGIPKTTVFEFVPKNGPRIQTITTTVAKTNHQGPQSNSKSQISPEKASRSGNFHLTEETDKFPSRKYIF